MPYGKDQHFLQEASVFQSCRVVKHAWHQGCPRSPAVWIPDTGSTRETAWRIWTCTLFLEVPLIEQAKNSNKCPRSFVSKVATRTPSDLVPTSAGPALESAWSYLLSFHLCIWHPLVAAVLIRDFRIQSKHRDMQCCSMCSAMMLKPPRLQLSWEYGPCHCHTISDRGGQKACILDK